MQHRLSKFAIVAAIAALAAGCAQEGAGGAETTEAAMTHKNNHIDYVEFAAEDLGAIKIFYGEVFGWEFQDWGPDYVSFSSAGLEGGFNSVQKPAEGTTMIILYADDLEASEARVVAAGGEVTERHEFPGGRRFHFRDPAGNVLGVWTIAEAAEE